MAQIFRPLHRIRARQMADGSWRTPFDPNFAQHRANDYCEGNAWQYWLAPWGRGRTC